MRLGGDMGVLPMHRTSLSLFVPFYIKEMTFGPYGDNWVCLSKVFGVPKSLIDHFSIESERTILAYSLQRKPSFLFWICHWILQGCGWTAATQQMTTAARPVCAEACAQVVKTAPRSRCDRSFLLPMWPLPMWPSVRLVPPRVSIHPPLQPLQLLRPQLRQPALAQVVFFQVPQPPVWQQAMVGTVKAHGSNAEDRISMDPLAVTMAIPARCRVSGIPSASELQREAPN